MKSKENNYSFSDKIPMVLNVLWKTRHEDILAFEIGKGLKGKITEGELDTILTFLVGKGQVSTKYLKIDGYETSILKYKLSASYILVEEERLKKGGKPWQHEKSKREVKSNLGQRPKPTFKREATGQIFEILKDFFSEDEQPELKRILTTGENSTGKLVFIGSGKTLLDFFKQLIKGQFLIVAVQKDLEKWCVENFMFLHRGTPRGITLKYAERIISGNERAAKGNRLIDIQNQNGVFTISKLEIQNREQDKK